MKRPAHLRFRQSVGRAFGESALLLRSQPSVRNAHGIPIASADPVEVPITCAVAPFGGGAGTSGLLRTLEERGVRIDGSMYFWVRGDLDIAELRDIDENNITAADSIVYKDVTYKVVNTQSWRNQIVVVGERQRYGV